MDYEIHIRNSDLGSDYIHESDDAIINIEPFGKKILIQVMCSAKHVDELYSIAMENDAMASSLYFMNKIFDSSYLEKISFVDLDDPNDVYRNPAYDNDILVNVNSIRKGHADGWASTGIFVPLHRIKDLPKEIFESISANLDRLLNVTYSFK